MSKTSVPNEALSKLRFFSQLDPQQLAAFRRIAVRRKFAVGATVVRQGDLDSQLYAVTQGLLQVSVALSDSREIVLHLLRPGDLFGEVTLFDQKPRSATVTAMQPSELLSFPRDEVLSTLRHYPDVALKLLESMAGLIRRLTDRVEDLSALAVPARLAKKLLELADICGTPVGRNQVALPFSLSQQHLANHVQASREAVNKSIAVMVKQGLLHQTKCQIM
ncbi:MAG: Crp/Fnr family transcriptional regulator, partial [Myxococcaceae bacterium]|nr:Crp/Fnr family transcriptional regulator [Myxococcaceae bacterium]